MCVSVIKVDQNITYGNMIGTVSSDCPNVSTSNDTTINDVDSLPSTCENKVQSTGRKSLSRRRSLRLDDLLTNGRTGEDEKRMGTHPPTEECMQKLKTEIQAWRTMLEERKQKYKETKKRLYSECLKLDWDYCSDALSKEDKQFLNAQPDYEGVISKMNEVQEMATICMHMKQKTAYTSAKIITIAEQQEASVKKKIFKHMESYFA